MSSENWIDVINRAIQMSADWEVDDEESGQTLVYDVEALNDMLIQIESGATSDELTHQFGDYVGNDFERYIVVLEQAMDSSEEDDEGHEESAERESDDQGYADETSQVSEENDDSSGFSDPEIEEEPDSEVSASKPAKKSKKGLIVAGALSFLIVMLGGGGFVFYNLLSGGSAPVAQTNDVKPILKAKPKAPVNESSQPGSSNEQTVQTPTTNAGTSQSQPLAGEQQQITSSENRVVNITPMGGSGSENSQAQRTVQTNTAQNNVSAPPFQSASSNEQSTISMEEMNEIRDDLEDRIEDIKGTVSSQVSSEMADIRSTLQELSSKLSKIDDIESQIKEARSEKNKQANRISSSLQGLTRLGEFSILANAGVDNRVVALSPTNQVITLEEGERNILAAGSNLTVKEIVGDGEAVIFTDGWFIDNVRVPESLREQRLVKNQANDSDEQSLPKTRTASRSDSPNPAMIGKGSKTISQASQADERFPSIRKAPDGWEATALIPPRRAVIMTPEGNSITITPGTEIAGLGKVHAVKNDRVLAGQFFIPLSNL